MRVRERERRRTAVAIASVQVVYNVVHNSTASVGVIMAEGSVVAMGYVKSDGVDPGEDASAARVLVTALLAAVACECRVSGMGLIRASVGTGGRRAAAVLAVDRGTEVAVGVGTSTYARA